MSVDNKYQKLSDIDHVLKRSGVYVGSIKITEADRFVYNNDVGMFEKKLINYNPAF